MTDPASSRDDVYRVLACPRCAAPHVDLPGDAPHITHACPLCFHVWTPFGFPTFGIRPRRALVSSGAFA